MIAIYARQSVERPDSISIAMQVEHCRRICPAEAEVRVFTDRGFTGTNTHRPAFRIDYCAGRMEIRTVCNLRRGIKYQYRTYYGYQ